MPLPTRHLGLVEENCFVVGASETKCRLEVAHIEHASALEAGHRRGLGNGQERPMEPLVPL